MTPVAFEPTTPQHGLAIDCRYWDDNIFLTLEWQFSVAFYIGFNVGLTNISTSIKMKGSHQTTGALAHSATNINQYLQLI